MMIKQRVRSTEKNTNIFANIWVKRCPYCNYTLNSCHELEQVTSGECPNCGEFIYEEDLVSEDVPENFDAVIEPKDVKKYLTSYS